MIASVSNKDLAEAVWNIGDDRFYAFNSQIIIYRDDQQLYAKLLKTGKVHQIGSKDFTQYSRLSITDSNIVYCIASGPLEAETLLKIKVEEDGTSEISAIDQTMNTEELKGVEMPQSIIFEVVDEKNGGRHVPIEGFYYSPIVRVYCLL